MPLLMIPRPLMLSDTFPRFPLSSPTCTATAYEVVGGLAATLVLIAFPNNQSITAAPRWSPLQCQVVRALLEADILWKDYHAIGFLLKRGIVDAPVDKNLPKVLRPALQQLLARQELKRGRS